MQQVLNDALRPASQAVALLLPQVRDLLGQVGQAQPQVPPTRREPPQLTGLRRASGVEAAFAELGRMIAAHTVTIL